MVNRDYIIDRIKSRSLSLDEFDFEKLSAPPMMSLLTPHDIANLNYIARSIKLSSKLKEKYNLIDEIMRPRGFRRYISGTNRVAYTFIEDNSFIVKIALDSIGLKDNPCEFRNQMLFKPFVTKVFEVSPCGTVGIFERVKPITNREEFLAVADDIYTVINEIFIGEYILADFGTNFFMNWGIREASNISKAFGPVLLDFPYVYKLDGKKLYCNSPDPHSKSGCCDGVIDYDSGYNFLVCTKCGKRYKAKDLAHDGETRKIIIRENGGNKMKFKLSGGSVVAPKTVNVNGDKVETVPTMPNKPQVQTAPRTKKEEEKPVTEEKKEIKVETKENTLSVNGVSTTPKKSEEKVDPISFSSEQETLNTMDSIINHINEIRNLSGLLNDDDTLDLIDMILDLNDELDRDSLNKIHMFEKYADRCNNTFSKLTDEEKNSDEVVDNDLVASILNSYSYAEEAEAQTDDTDEEVTEETDGEVENNFYYYGFSYIDGKVKNVHDIDPEEPSKKAIVLIDEADNYILAADHSIIAIDNIDGRSVDSIAIVSAEWLKKIQAELNSDQTADDAEDEIEDDNIDNVEGGENSVGE